MKLLCLSNGHGEDIIAVRILQELQQSFSVEPVALPIVGEGRAYITHGIPIAGPIQQMPSGGFIYMDGRQLLRDVRGGLPRLTWAQLQSARSWAKKGGVILAVGDIVPLLFAWWSGAPYAFVGTAKSEYYLRDEQGVLPRRSWFERLENWSGSVYLPWERWLMGHPRCKAVFPRDRLTAQFLKKSGIPAFDLGNPMMDGLEPRQVSFGVEPSPEPRLAFALLPGSRAPEAYENWQVIVQAVFNLVAAFPGRSLLFLGAIAPGLEMAAFQQALRAGGWQQTAADHYLTFKQYQATLILTQTDFSDCLHQADLAIAMAGTATEQFVGLGKPALILPGKGPQFTAAFAEAQTRLLGPSVILARQPAEIPGLVQSLLHNPDQLQIIAENGRTRMGSSGAATRIAQCILEKLNSGKL
ncbi:MAG: lipid-A-disaccharide synthase-related protein [Elainellaceae cyanobacterium]